MTQTQIAERIRTKLISQLFTLYSEKGEDVGMISSGSFNMLWTDEDGNEGVAEIVVKIPKSDLDDYQAKRDAYEQTVADRAERKRKAEESKAKKLADKEAKKASKVTK